MKWLPFVILSAATIVLQTTVLPALAIHSIWPDWMFILAVHYALWGPWPDAAVAAWLLGLIVGLQTADRIGLHAFCFGAAAWAIIRVRQVLFRDHPVTQLLLTFVFALGIQMIVAACRAWNASVPVAREALVSDALFTALYTAAWAPFLHWPLIRLGKWTGLRPGRRSLAYR